MEHLNCFSLLESATTELPSSFERLKCLTWLKLSNCENLETLPNSIGNLTCLRDLIVCNCPKLDKLPDSLRSLQCCLEQLDVSGCSLMAGAIPDDLWCLFSLVSLDVSGNNIDCIPGGIIHLSQLCELRMNHCLMLKEIPELPSSLRRIEAFGCPLLETLSSDAKHPLWSSLHNCLKSISIQDFECEYPIVHSNYYDRDHHVIKVVIPPGSRGIPEWISHKSMGYEITIDLPKNWYEDNNFLGFALFSHHVSDNYAPFVCYTLELLSDGDQFGEVKTIEFILNGTDPASMVVYFPQIAISSVYRSNRWNKFKAVFSSSFGPDITADFKVESCGIHLIYNKAQDHPQQSLQQFNVKRSHDDTEDHPHHKRSKHV
ncbi:hypothetical protein PVL29_009273 [Vitis rotundifolia]|nr:hypothetical protein PVL29_009273 [Vitis rotundifolia]